VTEKYNDLSVDLYLLWEAGYHYIPLVADAYADAAGKLNAAADSDDAFSVDAPNSDIGGIYEKFDELRTKLTVVCGRVSERLYDVGEVMVKAADSFAATDEDNAVKIDYDDQKSAREGNAQSDRPDDLDTAPEVKGASELLPDDKDRESQEGGGD
jgi:hypothetical protein